MKKYNISIERKILKCNQKLSVSNMSYPKTFGEESKNHFIKIGEERCILEIKTPFEENVNEAYNKFQEISNVVFVELYNRGEIIWPYSKFDNVELSSSIKLVILDDYYNELKKINSNLPEKLNEALKNVKKQFQIFRELFFNIFGNCNLNINRNVIEINNIKINHLTRYGISQEQISFLIVTIFSLLEKFNEDFVTKLKSVNKLYSLNAKDAINNIIKLNKEKMSYEISVDLIKKYMQEGYDTRYSMQKYTKLVAESVVIIKDAISRGINYKVLNEAKSLVEFEYDGHREFVIEGNKTNRDSYIFPIITDDKFTSKQIMKSTGLCVPNAILLEKDMSKEEIEILLDEFGNKALAVKPRNTNYGIGITVFSKKTDKKKVLNAIEYAFKFDNNVLIEEYAKGMEYRFLVVNGKCVSVAHRRPASIVGDGKSTIKELIDAKNKEPWHALTGTPVKLDEPVVEYLSVQGLNIESIIPEGKRIFLRTNSNCSTGGEAVDMTEIMPNYFKKISEKAANAFNGKICGVDIIIENLEDTKYSIIEINDNPGYSINEWPYEGIGEKVGISILKLLDLIN